MSERDGRRNDGSWLSDFSAAMRTASEMKRLDREEFNRRLQQKEPVAWYPDPDGPEGHGTGWFRGDVGFFSYRKYSNGYDPNTCTALTDDLIRQLWPHVPPTGTPP